MKKISLLLLIILPLKIVAAQDNDPADFLKNVDASRKRLLTALSKKEKEYQKQLYDEYMQKESLEESKTNDVIDEIKNRSEYQSIAESQRQAARSRQVTEIILLPIKAKIMAEDEFYKELRNKYSYSSLSNEDYLFIEAVQPVIEASKNPHLERDRIEEAVKYINYFKNNSSDYLSVSRYSYLSGYTSPSDLQVEDVYLNIDKYRDIYNEIINRKQKEKEELEAAEKRSNVAIGFGIAILLIIVLIAINKIKKRSNQHK
jgi:hypothetical protein